MKAILCFGDSITFGRGEQPAKSWCGRLKDYFEKKDKRNVVYNLGIPGDTSKDLLKRIDSEAEGRIRIKRSSDKYLILIAIGTNDCKWDGIPEDRNVRMTERRFRKNIKKLISKAKKYEAKFAFIGLPPVDETKTLPFEDTSFKNERVKLFNDIVKKECEDNGVLFLDLFDTMDFKLLEDGLHPNSKGYDFMFKEVKKFIEGNGLI